MTYDPNIPLSTDLVSNSQQGILDNFTQLDMQFGVDHVPFDNGGSNGNGYHKQIHLSAPLAAMSPVVSGSQGGIYLKTVSGKSQPFYVNTTREVQLSGDFYNYISTLSMTPLVLATPTTTAYYYLSGGVTHVFGTFTSTIPLSSSTPATITITLPTTAIMGGNGGSGNLLITTNTSTVRLTSVGTISSNTNILTFTVYPQGLGGTTTSITAIFNGFYM